MAGASPGNVLGVLQCLSTPKKPQSGESKSFSLNSILEHNLSDALKLLSESKLKGCVDLLCSSLCETREQEFKGASVSQLQSILKSQSQDDIRWKYVLMSLATMRVLNHAQSIALERYNVLMQDMKNARPAETSAPPMSPDTLSFEQQKSFVTSLQFVVCLGVLPALQPGVGIPLERRTEFSKMLQGTEQQAAVAEQEKEWRMFYCLQALLSLFDQPSLATLILSRNFGDVLAGLLQLCCASSLRLQRKAGQQQIKQTTHTSKRIVDKDVEFCENQMKRLLEKIYPPLIVRELLVLQGGSGPTVDKEGKYQLVRSPPWLRRVCGRLLSDILMKPKGVQYVLKGLLHSSEGGANASDAADWQRCEAVSKVIAHCPRQSVSIQDYYRAIGPQVLELLHFEERKLARQYLRVAISTIAAMMQHQIALTLKYVIQPLLDPLIQCTVHTALEEAVDGVQVVVQEAPLERCVTDVHHLYAVTAQPHNLLLSSLHRCAHVLFRLYCFARTGVVHYRSKVEDIVLVYLRHAELLTALECVKAFVFEELLEHTMGKASLKTPLMCWDLCFMAGPSGGVIVVRSATMENGTWEQRCNAVVELLHKLQKDGLSADFFIYLLQQLTVILSEEVEGKEKQNSTAAPNRLEIDDREATLKRNLILLSLLASMCEKLGHTCFKSTRHILQFVKATLERSVNVLEHTNDVELGIFESETVTMAMGLLTAVMGGASKVTTEDREQTKELLPLLEKLSRSHPDETVKEMATDLRIAIATHGFVLSHVLNKANAQLSQTFYDNTKLKTDPIIDSTNTRKKSNKKTPKLNANHINVKSEQSMANRINTNEKSLGPDVKPKHNNKAAPASKAAPNPLLDVPVVKKSVVELLAESIEALDTNNDHTEAEEDAVINAILSSSPLTPPKPSKSPKKPLIEEVEVPSNVINDTLNEHNPMTNGHGPSEPVSNAAYRKNYKPAEVKPQHTSGLDQAFQELLDTQVPVRGHALISLRRLLENNDPEAVAKGDLLLRIFHENLDHSDTYIYLAAIQGLVALAKHDADKVVFLLAHEYANFHMETKKRRSPELRMKVGEVLTKCIRLLGETIPANGDLMLRCTLQGTKDKDHFVRASCLSNLAELCKLLHFSLGKVLFEVFECVSSLLKTDPESEVRQAAAMFITLLLQGLGYDSFKVLSGVLRDLYRLLKHAVRVEKNETVQMHVLMALQELDKIMDAFFFPKQTLTKKIGVRESPNVDLGLNK